ncbi:predicted protein [Botrytis cinerea T4]|uniref:Uncharacterized protein n=1 Tax=Botryotinia fuckeliana (strain T4) TaxID=999810 RepID=G2YPB2_BOTF4|nr:predicted protein [Botrytis cinerea T4]
MVKPPGTSQSRTTRKSGKVKRTVTKQFATNVGYLAPFYLPL